jgi:hypothetical protein
VTGVPGRWTVDRIMALAPDASSQRAATGLAGRSSWSELGTAVDLVWGLCAGSGKRPYQTVVDLNGPAYHCSCPSRKFPCKHALALLLNWAHGVVGEQAEPAGFAQAWKAGREARAVGTAKPKTGKDEAAAARRAEQRATRVAAGLAELEMWLRDQVSAGLSAAGAQGFRHAEAMAARMVDAQAPGVAGALRRLSVVPASGDGWPSRLLSEYALLHLLVRAHDHLDTLPPGLAAVVRSRVGYSTRREDVLALPGIRDRWQVLAARDVLDAPVPARRIWLRGRNTQRSALLLAFAPNGSFAPNPEAALTAGTELQADMHFYPGQPPLRSVLGRRNAPPAAANRPDGASGVTALLGDWAAALEADPWLTEWPALVAGTPVVDAGGWYLVDASGAGLPLAGQERLWTLLAVSGGYPVTVAGEWGPAGLIPLTVWHGDLAVRL